MDFIIMTVMTALLAAGVPVALIFIDIHILVKIMWAIMLSADVFSWIHAYLKYRSGKGRSKKQVKTKDGNEDALFMAGLTFVAMMTAFLGIGSFEYENPSLKLLAVLSTYVGIVIPFVYWRLNSKSKEEYGHC